MKLWLGLAAGVTVATSSAQLVPGRIPRDPDIHGDKVAFAAEGDLWIGDLKAGTATRLTRWPGTESHPRFSPDGTQIAFTGDYDTGQDVYVVSVSGGTPRRVTTDPAGASVVDWTPDGQSLLFRSQRASAMGNLQLFRVPVTGGRPTKLPMPKAAQGAISGDGSRIAFTEIMLEEHWWRRYEGGMANDVWMYEPATTKFTRLTQHPINEQYPVFLGSRLFFVSERLGTANLFELDLNSREQRQVTFHTVGDVQAPGSDGKRLIYRLGQDLWTWDPATRRSAKVALRLTSDAIHARPFVYRASLEAASPGPTGRRILVESRGQIFSAPVERGDLRPIAMRQGSRQKGARWSADGKTIAFISDRSDEENVWVVPVEGGEPKALTHFKGKVLSELQWAPNGEFLLVQDQDNTLWKIDAETGDSESLTQDQFGNAPQAAISQNSQWISFVRADAFYQSSLYLYRVADGTTTRLTHSPTRDAAPAFDRSGRYLFFLSDRGVSLNWDPFDFQLNADVPTQIMFFPLTREVRNPFAETADEERGAGAGGVAETDPRITVDLDGIAQRVMRVPGVQGQIRNLRGGGGGRLFWIQDGELKAYDLDRRQERTIGRGVGSFELSADGNRIMATRGGRVFVGSVNDELPDSPVDLSDWSFTVDPVAEWRQILREAWRTIRDTFYDPKLHGADWPKVWEEISAQLPAVGDREDLNDLIGQMQANLNVSHMYNGGGSSRFDVPDRTGMGYLGIDTVWDGQGLKIERVFQSDGFNLGARSPLASPEIGAKAGEYLLAIQGQKIDASTDVDALLLGTGGKMIRVTLGPKADGTDSRTVWVRPAQSDRQARYFDWVGQNRQRVTERAPNVAYLHIPDMGEFGMAEFTKHFYPNLHRDGIILDVRYNGGGITSGMILERLRRVTFEYDQSRAGAPVPYHRMGFLPKVVVITNEMTASDGEYFSVGFRAMRLGRTVGSRTWGGFVAVGGFQSVDGGFVSNPFQGSFTPEGKWLPDGYGFKPDIEVDLDPASYAAGRDPQLDRAIEVILGEIRRDPPRRPARMTPPTKLP